MRQRHMPRDPGDPRRTEVAPSFTLMQGEKNTARPTSIQILIAARTVITTELFCSVLSRDERFSVHPYASSVSQQHGRVFDVAMISAGLEYQAEADGIDLARRLQTSGRVAKTVVLLDQPTRSSVLQAFRAGARGVFCSRQSVESLSDCLWNVHNGQVWASNEHLDYLLQALGEPAPVRLRDTKGGVLLCKREEDVVSLVLEGLTNREIADRLALSEHTIKNYLFRIFDKLGISNRSELIIYTLSRSSSESSSCSAESQVPGARIVEGYDQSSTLDCTRDAAERLCAVQSMLYEGSGVGSRLTDAASTYMWLLVTQAITESTRDYLEARLTPEQVVELRRRAAEWIKSRAREDMAKPMTRKVA